MGEEVHGVGPAIGGGAPRRGLREEHRVRSATLTLLASREAGEGWGGEGLVPGGRGRRRAGRRRSRTFRRGRRGRRRDPSEEEVAVVAGRRRGEARGEEGKGFWSSSKIRNLGQIWRNFRNRVIVYLSGPSDMSGPGWPARDRVVSFSNIYCIFFSF